MEFSDTKLHRLVDITRHTHATTPLTAFDILVARFLEVSRRDGIIDAMHSLGSPAVS